MTPASDKKSNFFFANCLHCEGIIRLPIAIRPGSFVNCPHCSSQFELIDFMDQIPEVEVVAGQQPNGTASPSEEFHIETEGIEKLDGKFVVPPQLAAGIRKRRRRRRKRSEASQNGTATDPGGMTEADELKQARREDRAQRERDKIQQQREQAAVQVDPKRRRPSSRPPVPKRNPVLEGLKIIFGGILAAPIAYLLLMWIFSKDPLQLSPTIHSYAPLLVPESLIFEEDEELPAIGSKESIESLRGLPIPETDPDDVDPMKIDLDIE